MRIEYRRPIGRMTGLARDPQALRVLARAQAMRDAGLAPVVCEGDLPQRQTREPAPDEPAPDPRRPWCDWTKMSAANNSPGMLSLQSRE